MKKILIISLVAGLALLTGCTSRLSEYEKNSDYYNTLIRGAVYHNQIVLLNQDQKILENQELIIKQNEEILKALNEKN
jgi:hypothetical protein